MNIDTIILLVLGAFFLIGFVRGFIREVGAFLGFFVSLWVAGHYYSMLIPSIKPALSQWPLLADGLSVVLAFLGLFVISQILFGIVIKLLDFIVRRLSPIPFLKTTNRLAGGAVGLLEGVLLLSAILYLLLHFPFSKDLTMKLAESKFVPHIEKASKIISPFLPDISKYTPTFMEKQNFDMKQLQNIPALKEFNLGDFDLKKFQQMQKLSPEVDKFLKEYEKEQQLNKRKE